MPGDLTTASVKKSASMTLRVISPEEKRRAMLAVCGRLEDKEASKEVLMALGLIPDPEHKPTTSVKYR